MHHREAREGSGLHEGCTGAAGRQGESVACSCRTLPTRIVLVWCELGVSAGCVV